MSVMEKALVDVGSIDDVPQRGSRLVNAGALRLAVFRTADDQYFAIEDSCPHKKGPLSQGIVHGHAVTCPLHNWVIDLASGEAQGADSGCVATIPLHLKNGRVLLDLSAIAVR